MIQISSHDSDRKTFEVITSTLPHGLLVSLVASIFLQGNPHRKTKCKCCWTVATYKENTVFFYQCLDLGEDMSMMQT